jgi:uncharacterized protein
MRWLAAFLLCLLPFLAQAEDVPVPPLKARVTDLTGTLTADQQAGIESRLAAFEQKKGSQIALLIVPSTQPEDIAQYSIRVVEQWKLGRKGVDDGVLLLVAKNDRTVRIEVGYGLEGALNDATCKRIIEEFIVPKFKQGDFHGGLTAGLDRIIGVIDGEPLPAAKPHKNTGNLEQYFTVLVFVALIVGGILRAVFGDFLGGVLNGGLIGVIVWFLGAGLLFALLLGFVAFIATVSGLSGMLASGGFGGGRGGGGFSGGGGGFGGGGASGRW